MSPSNIARDGANAGDDRLKGYHFLYSKRLPKIRPPGRRIQVALQTRTTWWERFALVVFYPAEFVTPAGRSLLIDTGWPGFEGRDADRIVATAKNAGLKKIDYVLITHFHNDHAGGAPQLGARIPIATFVDHGENRENTDAPTVQVWPAGLKV